MTGSACNALADRRSLQIYMLPVTTCPCSATLASSCSISRAEAASQTSSAALPVMSLQAVYELDGSMHARIEWAEHIRCTRPALLLTHQAWPPFHHRGCRLSLGSMAYSFSSLLTSTCQPNLQVIPGWRLSQVVELSKMEIEHANGPEGLQFLGQTVDQAR